VQLFFKKSQGVYNSFGFMSREIQCFGLVTSYGQKNRLITLRSKIIKGNFLSPVDEVPKRLGIQGKFDREGEQLVMANGRLWALLILIIAAINFINLSTARSPDG
jgi:hypothetical protein